MAAGPKAPKAAAKARDFTELDIEHPEMFKILKEWGAGVAGKLGVPHFHILHQKVLVQISVCLPENDTALAGLKGIGPKTIEKYGEQILHLVREYRTRHQIKTVILPEPEPEIKAPESGTRKKPKTDTRQISLDFFRQGMDIQAISDERGLAVSTIQNHLCHFIEDGSLSVDVLVDQAKREAIEKVLCPGMPLREVKDKLGSEFSYNEIQAVVSHQKHAGNSPDDNGGHETDK